MFFQTFALSGLFNNFSSYLLRLLDVDMQLFSLRDPAVNVWCAVLASCSDFGLLTKGYSSSVVLCAAGG